ncbi:MAG: bifunctional (p)ppGpp synthetase/guanosine-3',5'-bis(diphosphate) 3'-pyrophosphohydrolase [Chloroflexi bacterium]|nr:bifunctional (p)ppGpp synthetase/guanosine-3',5'-bis(diphosphate) 3'-pyrophosphohydrolase [Chloroflexota bacterium]
MATQTRKPGRSSRRRNGKGSEASRLGSALLKRARTYLPEDRLPFVEAALSFAVGAHEGQLRKSGVPYIEHPLATAEYLAELHMDAATLAAGLLHDVMEDCDVPYAELEMKFSGEVASLVDSVTKLSADGSLIPWNPDGTVTLGVEGDHQAQEPALAAARAASMRKMLVAMARDVRVVVIKLADRLHNMLTLKALPPHRQIAIARETLDIYAPLAHRLGMGDLKWRLEDEAFKYLLPRDFRAITRLLSRKRAEREEYIERATKALEEALSAVGLEAEVTGRPKHLYSIYQKIDRYAEQGKKLEEIYDLFALRVIVKSEADCYAALGAIHGTWPPISGQFDDYIATPKDNMYQSLHTTVRGLDNFPLEVQIRTPEMHQISEHGVAAHPIYKEGGKSVDGFEQRMSWLKQLLEIQRETGGDFEWLEEIKTDILQDQVFVYTPAGDVVELPAGATALDFAYKIHTEVGHSCNGAIVNGKLTALNAPLHNGDTVRIRTAKQSKGPKLDWLNPDLGYLRTTSARTKVAQWFRRQARQAQRQQGREFLAKQLRRLHHRKSNEEIAREIGFESANALYEAIGSGQLHAGEVVTRLMSTNPDEETTARVEKPIKSAESTSGTLVMGMSGLLTRDALCCNPVYGDDIVGYLTRNRGVTIHRSLCPNMRSRNRDDPERLVEVAWGHSTNRIPARFRIDAFDRVGLIRDLTSVVGAEQVNIHSLTSNENESDTTCSVTLTVYTTGSKQLSRLFSRLENVKGVFGIVREGLA